jgi:hypothetical protein
MHASRLGRRNGLRGRKGSADRPPDPRCGTLSFSVIAVYARSMSPPISVIYSPPRHGLAYLVVTIVSDNEVLVISTHSRHEAHAMVAKLSRTRRHHGPKDAEIRPSPASVVEPRSSSKCTACHQHPSHWNPRHTVVVSAVVLTCVGGGLSTRSTVSTRHKNLRGSAELGETVCVFLCRSCREPITLVRRQARRYAYDPVA